MASLRRTLWHFRSGLSIWLLGLALDVAPASEKPALARVLNGYVLTLAEEEAP